MPTDVYSRVTQKIIADLERGERLWFKPWNALRRLGATPHHRPVS